MPKITKIFLILFWKWGGGINTKLTMQWEKIKQFLYIDKQQKRICLKISQNIVENYHFE